MEVETETSDITNLVGADRGDGTALTFYVRNGPLVSTRQATLRPWLLTARQTLPTGTPTPASFSELSGSLPLRHLVTFSSWADLWSCVRAFLESESALRGQRVSSYAELSHLFLLADPIDQWLVHTGTSCFTGLDATALKRCTLALSTGNERPRLSDAEQPDASIRLVSLREENGEQTSFRIRKKDEAGLLRDVIQYIVARDPDLLCGTELHSLYLPYFSKRCILHGLEPAIGRQGRSMGQHPATLLRTAMEVPGRSIIDLSDIVLNAELIELVGMFRLRRRGSDALLPVIADIRASLDAEPTERVKLMDRHIAHMMNILLPLIQSTPLTPGHLLRSNASTRVDMSMISAALKDGTSILASGASSHGSPQVEAPYRTGIYSRAVEIVLVPLQLSTVAEVPEAAFAESPGLVRTRLQELRTDARSVRDKGYRNLTPVLYDIAQGWVQACRSRHSRYYQENVSRELTRTHGQILKEATEALALHNIRIIQYNDDTLICHLPDNAHLSMQTFWNKVEKDFPHGLRPVLLDQFDVCVSLGPRIFAITMGKRMMAHRRARIPRFFEPFLRDFFTRALDHSLHRDWTALRELYIRSLQRIQRHSWHVLDFARHETLGDSFEHYDTLLKAGKRHPSAAYEALRATNPDARAGTTVRYYITGSKKEITQAEHSKVSDLWDSADPDENTEYYLDRLSQCIDRFRILFEPGSFSRLFGGEDLFGFDPDQIVTVEHRSEAADIAPGVRGGHDLSISLDLEPKA